MEGNGCHVKIRARLVRQHIIYFSVDALFHKSSTGSATCLSQLGCAVERRTRRRSRRKRWRCCSGLRDEGGCEEEVAGCSISHLVAPRFGHRRSGQWWFCFRSGSRAKNLVQLLMLAASCSACRCSGFTWSQRELQQQQQHLRQDAANQEGLYPARWENCSL